MKAGVTMSFDLSFLWCDGNRSPSPAQLEQAMAFAGAGDADDQARMRQLAQDLVAAYPDATWNEAAGGLARGAWVGDGSLPDIDIGPRVVFVSSRPDPDDPEELAFYRALIGFFHARGYVCFDHQRGDVVAAAGFTFG
jgi:hypothetical protein